MWPPPFGCLEGTSSGGDDQGATTPTVPWPPRNVRASAGSSAGLASALAESLEAIDDAVGLGAGKRPAAALWWARIAWARSLVRPSCRKKIRWPRPHSGAVRNSSPRPRPAGRRPRGPGPCGAERGRRRDRTFLPLSAATDESPVVKPACGRARSRWSRRALRPLRERCGASGRVGDGVGGARKRMKHGELLDRGQRLGRRLGVGVRDVIGHVAN